MRSHVTYSTSPGYSRLHGAVMYRWVIFGYSVVFVWGKLRDVPYTRKGVQCCYVNHPDVYNTLYTDN